MRRIGIIGAGQAGLILGISLLEAGYRVTLFSEITAEAILNSPPRAMPVLFPDALQIERNLGLNLWDDRFLGCQEFCNHTCDPDGNLVLKIASPIEQPWQAIDQRLKFSHWMREFVLRGGELIVRGMELVDLEECAKNYDLVIVCAGRNSFTNLFKRDSEKSKYDQPQRQITGVIVTGVKTQGIFQVTIVPGQGEIIQMPFYDRNQRHTHILAFEACIGAQMDRFSSAQNGQEILDLSKKLIQQFAPWDYKAFKDAELSDSQSWLRGAITPAVRQPIGYLPSGKAVLGIGDVVILVDPIAGQGANNATKMAHFVANSIKERGNQPFNEIWMQTVFNEFWQEAQYSNALSNYLLSPPEHLKDLFDAMSHHSEITKDYLNGVNRPFSMSPWFFEAEATKRYLMDKGYQTQTSQELVNV